MLRRFAQLNQTYQNHQTYQSFLQQVIDSPKTAWIITICFVLIGGMATLKIPLYQGSDEGWHYAYVEHYALGRPLVNLNAHFLSGDPAAPYWQTHEAAQPPLYYILMGRVVALIPRGDLIQEQYLEGSVPNGMYGNFLPADTGTGVLGTGVLGTGVLGTGVLGTGVLGTGNVLAGHVVRLLTVLMGAVVVICTYAITRLITTRADIALLATAVMAFNPRNIMLSAAVSNDMAVACCAAVALLLATYITVQGKPANFQRPGRFIDKLLDPAGFAVSFVLGMVAGASLLMKYSGGTIVIAAAVALVCRAVRLKLSWRWLLTRWVCFGVGALLATGWFFVHNWQQYGDILAWNKVQVLMPVRATLRSVRESLDWLPFILQTNFQHPAYTLALANSYTHLMYYLLLLSMPGGLWLIWRRRVHWRSDGLIWLPLLGTLLINVLTFVPWLRAHDATQNMRFFSPSFVPITLLFVLGLLAFVPRRWQQNFALVASVGYGLFTAATLWQGFSLMYAFPHYVTGVERDTLIQRNYPGRVMFENGIELLDAQIKAHRLHVDQPIELTFVWRTTRPLTESAHLMLDVRDQNGLTIAAINTGNAIRYSYVARAWQVGEPVRETYLITAPVTSSQIVRVLAGWSTHSVPQMPIRPVNNPSVSVEVARVKIQVSDTAPPVVGPPIAHIGRLVDLQSAQINGDAIVLNWRATAQPDQNYTVFVHGLDAQGQIVAQNDMAFNYSAVYWHVGEVFEQRIPLKDRSKVVTIKIGVYDPVTLVRLTAQSADGAALAEDSVMLTP